MQYSVGLRCDFYRDDSGGPALKAFVRALWDMPVPAGEQRYFDGLVYLMSLMHVSGEFRIIEAGKR